MDTFKKHTQVSRFIAGAALLGSSTLFAQTELGEGEAYELTDFVITEQQAANIMPVTTYDTPVSNLEFNPRIDFQSRNMAEAQGDVTIRGGIFESTGFRVGSATLIDPQTGHYFAEIPIAPEMLTAPEVLIGSDNALYGFNSSVGTIDYGWTQIEDAGSLTAGFGDHDFNFQRIHNSLTGQISESKEWSWGAEVEYSRSESAGTIANGDHDFDRVTGRVQLVGPNSQTDLFAGYQAKFFGWPGMYTGDARRVTSENNRLRNETEDLKTRLFVVNHHRSYNEDSYVESTVYHRRHTDRYIFDRVTPNLFLAEHETEISSIGVSGHHQITDGFAINYASQIASDSIESNDFFNGFPLGGLERGRFTSREYYKLSILPEYQFELRRSESLTLRIGASLDDTNQDKSEISAITDLIWAKEYANGNSDLVFISYTETSQVVGYTAIGGSEGGLFASNPNLERETSQNLELGGTAKRGDWTLEGSLFYRWDDDLADWTFSNINTFARSANPVDIETFGIEVIATKRWKNIEGIASYTFLDKDEDYGDATIDGSFYALNYANHRITLGAIWTPIETVKFRIDNEWRSQEENALRNGDDEALFTHASVSFYPPQVEDLEIFLAVDNAWDDGFEEVPGTPGRGDQFSAGATYKW